MNRWLLPPKHPSTTDSERNELIGEDYFRRTVESTRISNKFNCRNLRWINTGPDGFVLSCSIPRWERFQYNYNVIQSVWTVHRWILVHGERMFCWTRAPFFAPIISRTSFIAVYKTNRAERSGERVLFWLGTSVTMKLGNSMVRYWLAVQHEALNAESAWSVSGHLRWTTRSNKAVSNDAVCPKYERCELDSIFGATRRQATAYEPMLGKRCSTDNTHHHCNSPSCFLESWDEWGMCIAREVRTQSCPRARHSCERVIVGNRMSTRKIFFFYIKINGKSSRLVFPHRRGFLRAWARE